MITRDEARKKLPPDFNKAYEFHGVIHPVSAKANAPDMGVVRLRFVFSSSEIQACLFVSGNNGKFCADVYVVEEIMDLLTFRNGLIEYINSFLDLSCLYDGWPYHAEIEYCITPSGDKANLNLYSPAIQMENEKYQLRVNKRDLTMHKCFPFLTYALKDFRRAIQDPLETYALVYRSIESIRNYYASIHGIDTEKKSGQKKSWGILRETLGYERDDFKFLEDRATARRHGKVDFSDAAELEKCRIFAWKFLTRFIENTFGTKCLVPPRS